MKFFLQRSVLYTLLLGGILFLSSCISNTNNDNPPVLQLGLEVQNIDSTQIMQGDTLIVENVRLMFGKTFFNLQNTDSQGSDSLRINNEPIMREFDPEQAQYANPRLLAGGQIEPGVLESLFFSITRASRDGDQDSGFTDENNRYSMIIRGSYNGADYTYKTDLEFGRTFSFAPVPVEDNGQYTFLVQTDAEDWFVDNVSGGYLNPEDGSDQIESNIQGSFNFDQLQ